MIVSFIGTNVRTSKHHSAHSLVISHNSRNILVDYRHNVELPEITDIILTQARQAKGLRNKNLNLAVYVNKHAHKQLSKEEFPFRRKIFWKKPFRVGDVTITPVPVVHSVKFPTTGLIIEADNHKLGYFPNVLDIFDKSILKGLDVYIGDGRALEKDVTKVSSDKKYGHASIRTQLQWLEKHNVKRAIFVNFGAWAKHSSTVREVLKSLGKEFNLKVAEALDGYRITFGRRIRLQRHLPGIYLKKPHAIHIAEGRKKIIVSATPPPVGYQKLFLIQNGKIYGIIRLTKTHGPLPADEIRALRDKHQITDEEWNTWWPDRKTMYYFEFTVEKLFIPPKDYKMPQDVEKWIASVRLQQSIESIQEDAEKQYLFAPVRRFGDKLGRKIKIKEILESWDKPIVLKEGFITLMGGLTNWGETEGDIDVMQKDVKEIVERDQPILFRLGRALPTDISQRLRRRFIGEYGGIFTSHVPIYDLILVPSTNRHLVRMQRIQALRDPNGRKQASTSLKEDKVLPLRFIAPLKGYKGYYKFVELAAKDIEQEFSEQDYPLHFQKKYDGVIVVWMKKGNEIIARSDSGFDVTKRFPKLIAIARRLWPHTVTLLSETELWINGIHQPREKMAGYLSAHTSPDDSNVVSNIFDIVYYSEKGDIHKEPYEVRYSYLRKIDFPQSTNGKPKIGTFNLTPSIKVSSPREIASSLEQVASFEASEGAVIKSSKGIYELDGSTRQQIKWKKMAEIHSIILGKIETRTPNIFNLEVGLRVPSGWQVPQNKLRKINNKTYMYIGKTFNVSQETKVGDIISMTFHTLNHYVRRNEQYVTVYESKFMDVRPQRNIPDSVVEAIEIAQEKELLVRKRLQKFPMDDNPHSAVLQVHYRDPYYDMLVERLCSFLSPGSYEYERIMDKLIHTRFLGKSAHMDFRIKVNNSLIGPTMFIAKPGAIREDVTTVKQAKEIEKNWERYFKLKNVSQTEIIDLRRKIQISWKKPEPVDWLTVEGVVPKGEVGATKFEFGVFSIVDKPTVYFGAQKAYFKEFFISGKIINGRWIIRYLPNPWKEEHPREPFVFLMWKPEDQTPYVLTKRAVDKRWVPPPGISCLPPKIRRNVPTKYKFWFKKNISERLAIRDELVRAIRKGEIRGIKLQNPPDIKQPVTVRGVLQHHWWRGQLVVRAGPSKEQWELRMEISKDRPLMHFVLRDNPQYKDNITSTYKPTSLHKWMDVKGIMEIPPGSPGNPTKNTPSFIQTIDSGRVQILESGSQFMKLKITMKKLRGIFTFKKSDPRQNLWVMKKEEK